MSNGVQDKPQPAPALQRQQPPRDQRGVREDADYVASGIAVAAIILFAGIGSMVIPAAISALFGQGPGPDRTVITALLLNIAILLLGWRRYRELTDEVAERRRAEDKARILAETDALTGMLNRRSLGPAADRLFAEAAQRGQAVAIVMLDLDNFKRVNDVNGHAAGDTLLIESASRLCEILPSDSLLGRIGGDEFACVFPFDPQHPDRVERLVERLICAVARPVQFAGSAIETTISAGIAAHQPQARQDALSVLHNADIAMYHAKKRGRNRLCWFDPAMEAQLRQRSELEAAIRRGVTNDEFVPFYHKQIDLSTGALTGFEMLARWETADGTAVGPDIFVPIAEEIGLIDLLSEQLIRKALHDARRWNHRLNLAINISSVQLRNPWFAQKLLKLLVEANFPPSRLELEITESALLENLGLVRTMVASLKNQGVKIVLDDFGAGHSSLARLRSLPFDRIKIDSSLVATVTESTESEAIVRSIVSLGDGLGLPITAEGIETREVLARMLEFGPFRGQGYLYGQPQSAEQTQAELRALHLLQGADETSTLDPQSEALALNAARIA
ncbi:putative bifunctional diguanylate cyclase/phosphodiesterase [Novosphingobium sp.]|uniref:putative bifunctional diguanylate cyclase/phosphodiesterase n=1 Tax=Novosphingobium sp. TaxID=1874826 RepID=UPI0035B1D499